MKEYKRLTKKDKEYGNYVQNELSELNEPSVAVSCYGKIHGTVIDRLAELEDKIENGTLIELPCKVGDMVWDIMSYANSRNQIIDIEIVDRTVEEISIDSDNEIYLTLTLVGSGDNRFSRPNEVFFTKAEAEQRLKELKEKEQL